MNNIYIYLFIYINIYININKNKIFINKYMNNICINKYIHTDIMYIIKCLLIYLRVSPPGLRSVPETLKQRSHEGLIECPWKRQRDSKISAAVTGWSSELITSIYISSFTFICILDRIWIFDAMSPAGVKSGCIESLLLSPLLRSPLSPLPSPLSPLLLFRCSNSWAGWAIIFLSS